MKDGTTMHVGMTLHRDSWELPTAGVWIYSARCFFQFQALMESISYEQGVNSVLEPPRNNGGYSRGRPSCRDFCRT